MFGLQVTDPQIQLFLMTTWLLLLITTTWYQLQNPLLEVKVGYSKLTTQFQLQN